MPFLNNIYKTEIQDDIADYVCDKIKVGEKLATILPCPRPAARPSPTSPSVLAASSLDLSINKAPPIDSAWIHHPGSLPSPFAPRKYNS